MKNILKNNFLKDQSNLYGIENYLKNILNDEESFSDIKRFLIKGNIKYTIILTAIKIYRKYLQIQENNNSQVFYKNNISMSNEEKEDFYDILRKDQYNYQCTYEIIKNNIYTIFVCCIIISYKYHEDISFTNDSWEPLSILSFKEINMGEKLILELLQFNISFEGEKEIDNEIQRSYKKNLRIRFKKIFCF